MGPRPSTHSFFSFEAKRMAQSISARHFSAAALKSHLNPNAKLWVDLPASRELASSLQLGEANSEAQPATALADASYVLAGTMVKGDPSYTWFHKNEFATVPHPSATPDHSPGCSTTSPYPVRSDWVAVADSATAPTAAATLNTYSTRLAKVHGWLQLANNPAVGSVRVKLLQARVRPHDRHQSARPGQSGPRERSHAPRLAV